MTERTSERGRQMDMQRGMLERGKWKYRNKVKKKKQPTGCVDSKGEQDKNLSYDWVYTQSPWICSQSPVLFRLVNTCSLLCHSALPSRTDPSQRDLLHYIQRHWSHPRSFAAGLTLFKQFPFIPGLLGFDFFDTLLDSCSHFVVTCQPVQATHSM